MNPFTKKLIVYGAGGHGKVVADVAMRAGIVVAGFVDDADSATFAPVLGLPVLGNRSWLLRQSRDHFYCAHGIGNNPARMRTGELLRTEGFEIATLISPFAVISPSSSIGLGALIMPGAVINPDAQIGDGVIVNTGVVVEHDCAVGRYANLSPNSTLGGGVIVGELAHIAIGATVMPYLRIGSRTTLGAGSVATHSIPEDAIAYGVPARVQRRLSHADESVPASATPL